MASGLCESISRATVRVLVFGADPAGWSVEVLAGPLIVGWVGLAIVASATHLLPAVGPGDPVIHGRQRQLLGRVATFRLVVLDGGILALAVGLPLGFAALGAVGAVLVALGLGVSAVLLGTAVTIGVRQRGVTRP